MQNDKFKFQPLQTLGKWYQPRNQKKVPKLIQKNPQTISRPFFVCDAQEPPPQPGMIPLDELADYEDVACL
jgi:hypothetical protein